MTTNNQKPIVNMRDVMFAYAGLGEKEPVLEHINLSIMPCDFLGIIGPNGGGKSTLLKLLLGLLSPTRGQVLVFGKTPRAVRHRIGYVPQYVTIDATVPATVLDVVLTGRLAKSSWGFRFGKKDREQAIEALEKTQMHHFAHRCIGELSGGQKQRVLIARALASEAELLLLDEPTTGVDQYMEQGITDLLHQLNEQMPIVMVSHDISFVSAHLKNVACLNRTLTCHAAHEISDDVIATMYHERVTPVHHDDNCPLHDQGCSHEHTTHTPASKEEQQP